MLPQGIESIPMASPQPLTTLPEPLRIPWIARSIREQTVLLHVPSHREPCDLWILQQLQILHQQILGSRCTKAAMPLEGQAVLIQCLRQGTTSLSLIYSQDRLEHER